MVREQATEPNAFFSSPFSVTMTIIVIFSGLIQHPEWYKIALCYGQICECNMEFFYLKKYLDTRTDDNTALFVTLDAPYDRLKISGVEIRLRQLGRRLNLERVHPHKFRRTMATRAIDKGMPIEQVQRILGHSQIDTTMQYAMVNQNNVKSSHQKYIA